MAKSKDKLIPSEEREMTEQTASNTAAEIEEYYKDENFWKEVGKEVEDGKKSWNRAMDEVTAKRLIEHHQGCKYALVVIIHKWPQNFNKTESVYQKKPEQLPKEEQLRSLEYLISRLAEIILEQDTNTNYLNFFVEEIDSQPTLLHLAAEQNFLHVSQCLVDRFPGLLYLATQGKDSALPVELALRKHKDDTAAYLISQMKYDRVQDLFLIGEEGKEDDEQPSVKFFFGDIISYRNTRTNEYAMKKTVLAVLNTLINPRWPYLPARGDKNEDNDDIQRALESVPNDPMNYDFYYHILESDKNGRQPKIEVSREVDKDGEPINFKWIANPRFNRKSVSCLRRIADSENKEAVKHPVVRMLVLRKWTEFARWWFCMKAALYVLFLAVLSFALIYGSTRDDPTQYEGTADNLRGFCEICSIIFLMLYLFEEIGEMLIERKLYFKIWHNYIDLLGIILTFIVLPLRFAEVKSQWSFAALGYLFNFLRLFKFSNVSRITGLYTTTLVKIVYSDITRFMVFFSVVFVGFCGALYMALKVNDMQDSFSNFAWVMLAGFRALVEGEALEEEYQKLGWLVILLLLAYMGVVIVVLLNVLIAQLSDTYSQAKKIAKLQYAADIMMIVSRLEYSRFARWDLRLKNYRHADWISDEKLAKEMLEFTEDRHPWETVGERLTDVREIMREIVRKGKEKDPLETIDENVRELMRGVVRKGKEKDPLETIDEKLTHLTAIMEKFPESK